MSQRASYDRVRRERYELRIALDRAVAMLNQMGAQVSDQDFIPKEGDE